MDDLAKFTLNVKQMAEDGIERLDLALVYVWQPAPKGYTKLTGAGIKGMVDVCVRKEYSDEAQDSGDVPSSKATTQGPPIH